MIFQTGSSACRSHWRMFLAATNTFLPLLHRHWWHIRDRGVSGQTLWQHYQFLQLRLQCPLNHSQLGGWRADSQGHGAPSISMAGPTRPSLGSVGVITTWTWTSSIAHPVLSLPAQASWQGVTKVSLAAPHEQSGSQCSTAEQLIAVSWAKNNRDLSCQSYHVLGVQFHHFFDTAAQAALSTQKLQPPEFYWAGNHSRIWSPLQYTVVFITTETQVEKAPSGLVNH